LDDDGCPRIGVGLIQLIPAQFGEHQLFHIKAATAVNFGGFGFGVESGLSANLVNRALLVPGVRESNLNQNSIASKRDASFNVNGLRSTYNNFLLDGVDNNSYGTSNQGFSSQVVQLSPDAVTEFKVETSNYSAEFGRSGGATINVSLRSGTNDFHGTLWEFHRNTVLNARGFFANRNRLAKPNLIRNQFGATFGGPIQLSLRACLKSPARGGIFVASAAFPSGFQATEGRQNLTFRS